MIRKIALSGMRGRKKDTFLLSFVVFLSFLFIVATTLLYSSSETTKNIQRTNTFGSWQGSILNEEDAMEDKLLGLDEVQSLGKSRIIGRSEDFGLVGTFNRELLDMGHFQLHQGRFPESNDEIALELSQLSYFSRDLQIGDTLAVDILVPLYEDDMESVNNAQMKKLEPELRRMEEELRETEDLEEDQWSKYGSVLGDIEFIREAMGVEEDEPTPLNILYHMWGGRVTRNERTLEVFDGVQVVTKTSYLYASIRSEDNPLESSIEEVRENGTKISKSAIITRDMKVSGIVQTYSNLWDIDKQPVANSFISEDAGRLFIEEAFYLSEDPDLSDYNFNNNYFIDSNIKSKEFFSLYSGDFPKLRRNAYAYPETAGSTESTLTYGILAFIFIATIFSVFQIYLTQMKRRSRKIALFKSIGASNKQLRELLLWEVLYLLLLSIPLSIGGGILLVKLILYIMNSLGTSSLSFFINSKLLFLGILAGTVSVIIGMIIPMIKSMKIPLTGTISQAPKHKKLDKKTRSKIHSKTRDIKMQSFRRISIKNIKYNKSSLLFTLALYTIAISVLLGSIFLSFLAFEDYIDQVIARDKPDYGFEFDFGIRQREIDERIQDFQSIEGVENVEFYKAGETAFMWYEDIEKNQIYSSFKDIIPKDLIDDHFGIDRTDYTNLEDEDTYLVRDSIIVNTYSIDPEGALFSRFEKAIDRGSLDKKKFEEGKQLIVLMPMYYNLGGEDSKLEGPIERSILENTTQKDRVASLLEYSDLYQLSYDFRHQEYYERDKSLSPGDMIHLSIPKEEIVGSTRTNELAFHELEVGGIINYFPEKGIWPFSHSLENPVIIGSYSLITDLYPASLSGKRDMSLDYLRALRASFAPTKYGKSWAYVDIDPKADQVQLQVDLQRLSLENESSLHNYIESKDIVFGKAFSTASIIVILGLAVSFISLIILYNTSQSRIEQERERIGILQAIGVTDNQFKSLYFISGVLYGLASLILAHIFLALIVFLTTVRTSGPLFIALRNQLWLYPWKIHLLVSLLYFILTLLTYYLPLKKILKNQPVNNIRSLSN